MNLQEWLLSGKPMPAVEVTMRCVCRCACHGPGPFPMTCGQLIDGEDCASACRAVPGSCEDFRIQTMAKADEREARLDRIAAVYPEAAAEARLAGRR